MKKTLFTVASLTIFILFPSFTLPAQELERDEFFFEDLCGENSLEFAPIKKICFGFSQDGLTFWDRVQIDGQVLSFDDYIADEDEAWVEFQLGSLGNILVNYEDGEVVSFEGNEGIEFFAPFGDTIN